MRGKQAARSAARHDREAAETIAGLRTQLAAEKRRALDAEHEAGRVQGLVDEIGRLRRLQEAGTTDYIERDREKREAERAQRAADLVTVATFAGRLINPEVAAIHEDEWERLLLAFGPEASVIFMRESGKTVSRAMRKNLESRNPFGAVKLARSQGKEEEVFGKPRSVLPAAVAAHRGTAPAPTTCPVCDEESHTMGECLLQ